MYTKFVFVISYFWNSNEKGSIILKDVYWTLNFLDDVFDFR